jgi:hypothetical protein
MNLIFRRPEINRKGLLLQAIPVLLFIWYFITASIHPGNEDMFKIMERKSALLFIPIMMFLAGGLEGVNGKWAMRGFISSLGITGLAIIARAIYLMIQGEGMEEWTYHAMMVTEGVGAIYYSWFLAIAIIYLLYRPADNFFQKLRYPLILFFLVLLLMASSKLFILLSVPFTIWKLLIGIRKTLIRIVVLIFLSGLILAVSIPFLQRVQDLDNTDLSIVNQDQYDYNTPFDGITLRLVQWRFGLEIMNDQHAWLFGTGLQNSQILLDEKYLEYGVYTGDPEWNNTGYLGYNFHNQFVETMIGTGLIGLIGLILIFVIAWRLKKSLMMPFAVYVFTFMFFMTESVLERQAGIILFCLLICTITIPEARKQETIPSS